MAKPAKVLRVAMAQLNVVVGDIGGNAERILAAAQRARDDLKAGIVVFPELALTGYPPEDLLLRAGFIDKAQHGINMLRTKLRGIDAVIGLPWREQNGLYNAALWLREGEIIGRYFKHHLPNYSVFDEKRYFQSGGAPCVIDFDGVPVGVTICEDLWHPGPMASAAQAGAKLMLNLNASPYHIGKHQERESVLRMRVAEAPMPVVYVNLVGGQDELVFDGGSMVMNAEGRLAAREVAFEEGLFAVDFHVEQGVRPVPKSCVMDARAEQDLYRAIVLGIRDYVNKNGFSGAVLGLSGGIDSALTLALAVDALGADQVEAVMMPSRYTAAMSVEDAKRQAQDMGVGFSVISIEPVFDTFLRSLRDEFKDLPPDVTEENIQARCRGVILMAISNKKRKILLTTGNKSEMAVGYATLYGDMAGGFAPIKDLPKTWVYRLARYRNSLDEVIPARVIDRPPSAELAPNQTDQDSLPPYDVLDPILELYIEQDKEPNEIVKAGFDEATVRKVVQMVNRNEYKRRQAPPGVRVTRRAFGRDRRYPITAKFWT